MLTNFTRNKSLLRIATLSLVVFGFSQLAASAGASEQTNETTVVGKTTALVLVSCLTVRLRRDNCLRLSWIELTPPAPTRAGRTSEEKL